MQIFLEPRHMFIHVQRNTWLSLKNVCVRVRLQISTGLLLVSALSLCPLNTGLFCRREGGGWGGQYFVCRQLSFIQCCNQVANGTSSHGNGTYYRNTSTLILSQISLFFTWNLEKRLLPRLSDHLPIRRAFVVHLLRHLHTKLIKLLK